jgi:hypothetical protein
MNTPLKRFSFGTVLDTGLRRESVPPEKFQPHRSGILKKVIGGSEFVDEF